METCVDTMLVGEIKARRIVLGPVGLDSSAYAMLGLQASPGRHWWSALRSAMQQAGAERPSGGADSRLGFCHSLHPASHSR